MHFVKTEFLEHVEKSKVSCAKVKIRKLFTCNENYFTLPRGYSNDQWNNFLDKIAVYSDEYEVSGTIWYENPYEWSVFHFEGNGKFKHFKIPEIPNDL